MTGLNRTSSTPLDQLIKGMAVYVGWLLLFSAVGFYLYGIVQAIVESFSEEISYNPYLLTTIGSIQALLLANLGAVLGIKFANPGSNIGRALSLTSRTSKEPLPPPLEGRDKVQLFALALFTLSLISCFITWIVKDFSINQQEVVSIIPDSGKMFIAVVLSYVTAIVSPKPST